MCRSFSSSSGQLWWHLSTRCVCIWLIYSYSLTATLLPCRTADSCRKENSSNFIMHLFLVGLLIFIVSLCCRMTINYNSRRTFSSCRDDIVDLLVFGDVKVCTCCTKQALVEEEEINKFWQTETLTLSVNAVCELLMASGCLKMHPQPFCRTERKQ